MDGDSALPEGERLASVVDIKPSVEFLTIRNLDTGEEFVIGENDPDFDFHTFELGAEASIEPPTGPVVPDAAGTIAAGEAVPPPAPAGGNSSWWGRMLHWLYGKNNSNLDGKKASYMQTQYKPKTPFTKLSSFRFHKELGKGAFGRVLLAEAKVDGKLYALKIISKKDMRSSDKRQAKTERDILLAMSQRHSHPFTTGLKFAFQSAHNLYLGMDFFPGGNLKELIRKFGHLKEDWVRVYSAELVLAISHLHSLKVIYRDIKPHNVMIDAQGHIVLIDYGLSKTEVSDPKGAQSLVGTPDYSAPEVLKTGVYKIEQSNKMKENKTKINRTDQAPAENVDIGYGKAADWWSLGVMVYEMLAGTPAFRGKDLRQTYQKVLFADLVFEPEERFSAEAKELLRGLLHRTPSMRLGSGENPPTDIMSQPFFQGIDWVSIFERKENGPVVPAPIRLVQREKSSKPRPASDGMSDSINPKLNLRDSIISPGNLLNGPNALQDWSFFDEGALASAGDKNDEDHVDSSGAQVAMNQLNVI